MTRDRAINLLRKYAAGLEKSAKTTHKYEVRIAAIARAKAYRSAIKLLRRVKSE